MGPVEEPEEKVEEPARSANLLQHNITAIDYIEDQERVYRRVTNDDIMVPVVEPNEEPEVEEPT